MTRPYPLRRRVPRRSGIRPHLAFAAAAFVAGPFATAQQLPEYVGNDAALHVLRRMTFGPTSALVSQVAGPGGNYAAFLNQQLNPATIEPNPAVGTLLGQLNLPSGPAGNTAYVTDIQLARMIYAFLSRSQLREIMAEFWENHFNTPWQATGFYLIQQQPAASPQAIWHQQTWLEWDDYQYFRANALGSFRDLLERISTSPTMMIFLNQVYNGGCVRPNENYAREFLELYSMGPLSEAQGQPNYEQDDVEDVARAFTGWGVVVQQGPPLAIFGQFGAPGSGGHCSGPKTIFEGSWWAGPSGVTITSTGEQQLRDIVDLVASAQPTREFICRKLIRYFIADEAGDPGVLDPLLGRMTSAWGTDGDIRAVLTELFSEPAFWGPTYRWRRAQLDIERVIGWLRRAEGDMVSLRTGLLDYGKLLFPRARLLDMGPGPFEFQSPDGIPYESNEQPSSARYITTSIHYTDVYRQFLLTSFPFDLFPTVDLIGIVQSQLSPAQQGNANLVANVILEHLYGSNFSEVDHAIIRTQLLTDVDGNTLDGLDPNNLLSYTYQVNRAWGHAGTFRQGFLK